MQLWPRMCLLGISVLLVSGCAGFGFVFTPPYPSLTTPAFSDRFPENLQGMVLVKPVDSGAKLDYHTSIWESDGRRYDFRAKGEKESPYVALMLPPGRYSLKRLQDFNYWVDLDKAIVTVDGRSYGGEPGFEVVAGKVSYLGDIKISSSRIKSPANSGRSGKIVTHIVVESDMDSAAAFLKDNHPRLIEYLQPGLVKAYGDVIRLGGAK